MLKESTKQQTPKSTEKTKKFMSKDKTMSRATLVTDKALYYQGPCCQGCLWHQEQLIMEDNPPPWCVVEEEKDERLFKASSQGEGPVTFSRPPRGDYQDAG
jgi:hypothetical protein